MNDRESEATLTTSELVAWLAFANVLHNFLSKHKHCNYENMVATILDKYLELGCNMGIKLLSRFTSGFF